MPNKIFWDEHEDWKAAEAAWDQKAQELKASHPLKKISKLPNMPGIAEAGIKRKGLVYLLRHDKKKVFWRHFFKSPIRYTFRLFKSYLQKQSYRQRDGDFFLYGISSLEEIYEDPKALLLLGFSYCHKPFECPSGRFTDECIHEPEHPVCRQCFIGKCAHAAPRRAKIVWIPTIHYIGEKIFDAIAENPKRNVHFLITACEMSLEMFGDWGNMVGAKGIGVRLDGRICNTMRAFELSEKGIKPGLTVVLDETQTRILNLLRQGTRDLLRN